MPVELDADERVQLGIDGREALGELLTWVTARRQFRERLGHLEPGVAGTGDQLAADLAA